MARKPKLSYPEQVQHLEQKGVSFALMSKRQALIYLRDNNNFFKLSSYRKNFNKDATKQKICMNLLIDCFQSIRTTTIHLSNRRKIS